jgi:cobalt-zinc-cadmium efflux system membrane fusion protein
MNKMTIVGILLWSLLLPTYQAVASAPAHTEEEAVEKGPHRGRMLHQDGFAVELAIFETGVPPEFRVWASKDGKPLSPSGVTLGIKLTRLGNVVDDIHFEAQGDYLRGDKVVYEPHSFVVSVAAQYQGKRYNWQYDNLEGRTRIEDKVAQAMNINTAIAGPATLHETIKVYGKLMLPADAKRAIAARFDGEIKQVHVRLGDRVKKGQLLLSIQSNESLKTYQVKAPMSGIISEQAANSGEQTRGRVLLEITRTAKLQAELAIFPLDSAKVKLNAPVMLTVNGVSAPVTGQISGVRSQTTSDQARLFWLDIDNTDGALSAGLFVTAQIEVGTHEVALAVKRNGLQSFRDFTVVYAKVGEEYEVRMLELGRKAGQWIEVLAGLKPGTEYVSENSYIIKADIEKSGASHDH